MKRRQSGAVLGRIAAIGYLGTAALHSTGYDSVVGLAAEVPSPLGAVMPGLWLAFSVDLAVLGIIVGLVAWRLPEGSAGILLVAALQPLGAAVLQLVYIGFVPPTAILLVVSALTLTAAALLRRQPSQVD